MDYFERNPRVFRLDEALKAVDVILQKLGIVIGHLFEVRNNPAIIDGVTMEPSGKMVIHSAARHFVERQPGHVMRSLICGASGVIEQ